MRKETPEEHRAEARIKAKERARTPKTRKKIVDKYGNPQVLTDYQKRELYKRAQIIKKRIEKAMLTHEQCWDATDRNVRLLEKREHGVDHLKREYRDIMEAIGASDTDWGVEKHRKRR